MVSGGNIRSLHGFICFFFGKAARLEVIKNTRVTVVTTNFGSDLGKAETTYCFRLHPDGMNQVLVEMFTIVPLPIIQRFQKTSSIHSKYSSI